MYRQQKGDFHMRKIYRNLLAFTLTAAMTAGQIVTVLANGTPLGPCSEASAEGQTEREAAAPKTQTSTKTQGPLGPDPASSSPAGPVASQSVTEVTVEQPQAGAVYSVMRQAYANGMPDDVAQTIREHRITVRLMKSDLVWSDICYIYANGSATIDTPQGFLSMSLFSEKLPGDILYRTYTSTGGWTNWTMNGAHSPFTFGVLAEAVQIRLTGVANDYYDVSYAAALSDGTTCGWSYNGHTNGAMGTGAYIIGLTVYLTEKGAYDTNGTANQVSCAAGYDGIRFGEGLPTYLNGTGAAYTGWAWYGNDRYYFVDNNAVSGWQYIDGYKYYFDEGGKLVTDLEPIIGLSSPLMIKINKQANCTTIYAQDGANGFIIPIKSFLCSTGYDTPEGTHHSPEKYRWRPMIHDVYCQYLTRLNSGLHILLHSDIYTAPNMNSLTAETYNYMGILNSSGCIRFVTKDAKWIYDNCPIGTTIQVYNSSIPGPYDRPCVEYYISQRQTWDPTDPDAVAAYGTVLNN